MLLYLYINIYLTSTGPAVGLYDYRSYNSNRPGLGVTNIHKVAFQPSFKQMPISRFRVSAVSVSSDLYRPIGYQFRMRRAHGLFLSQPITTLENISYIFLAQAAWKTQVYIENYNLLQHNKLAL